MATGTSTELCLSLDARVRRARQVVWSDIRDEVILLDPECGLYFAVNPTGRFLWLKMADPVTLRTLVDSLAAAFALTWEQAHADVARFITELRRHGLVETLAA